MKKRKLFLGIALLGCMFACTPECVDCGCDDCDDSGYGNFTLIRDWSNLWQGMTQPEELDVYLYHPTLAPWHRKTYTDTSYYNVPSGNYQVIAISKSNAVSFRGMNNYHTAEVCLPTRTVDSVLTVTEAPIILVDNKTVQVTEAAPPLCTVSPSPLIKVINFRFHIIRSGQIAEQTTCRATLSGVLTSLRLCTPQNSWFSARLDFDTQKDDSDFCKSVTLLGINPQIDHHLTVILTDTSGTERTAEVNLSGQLDFTTSPIQNCTVNINLTGTSTNVEITDWTPGTGGDIILK